MTDNELLGYDTYIVAFSGGKDSTACFLHLLDIGVPKEKIELWHHEIDGRGEVFMDWEITPDYCKKFAEAFNVPIYFSWKEGGFERELFRTNCRTAPTCFEDRDHHVIKVGGTKGKLSTRRKFPPISADLKVRWCSAYLKIDVCAAAIRNQQRFNHSKTLVISGERGQESAARSKYNAYEPDRSDNRNGKHKRWVDRWRPIKDWAEEAVWEIIQKYKVRPHPAYYLGWSRVSCKFCIFGDADQFASAQYISPKQGNKIMCFEREFNCTIKRDWSLPGLLQTGVPYAKIDKVIINQATSFQYTQSIFTDNWTLPAGAYAKGCGPS